MGRTGTVQLGAGRLQIRHHPVSCSSMIESPTSLWSVRADLALRQRRTSKATISTSTFAAPRIPRASGGAPSLATTKPIGREACS